MSLDEILHDDPALRIVKSRNLILAAWFGTPSLPEAQALGRAMALVAREYPLDFAVFNVIVRGTPSFADDFRAELGKIVAEPKNQGHGAAHVILVDGLAGVAVRAFLSTVFLVGRSASPNKVFKDARDASTWLAPRITRGQERWTTDDMNRAASFVVGPR